MNKAIAMVAGLAMLLAACGSSFSREDAIADLIESGLDQTVAECVVDGIEDKFSIEKLESTDDLSSEDEAILIEISTACILG